MAQMTDTINVSVPTAQGTLWVYGWREPRWLTARFTIERDESRYGGAVVPLAQRVDWTTAFRLLAMFLGRDTEATLRSALPS